MNVELYHTSTELQRLFRKEKDARLASRIRAVYLGLMGKTAPEIAALLGYRRRTIQNWVYAYNKHGLGLLAPYLNADTVNAFFRQFEQEVDPEVRVFMIWDQAGFHTSQKVKVPDNVTILPLPPYSPQLNPIEKLWQYLRQHYWSNRVYETYDHLRQAASQAWHNVCLNPEKIKTICRAEYVERAFI